jgi:hypothetical protein
MMRLKVSCGEHTAVLTDSSTVQKAGSNRLLLMVECRVAPAAGRLQLAPAGTSAGVSTDGFARLPSVSMKMPWWPQDQRKSRGSLQQ